MRLHRPAARPHPALDGMPVLSPGKHRSPRKGACFMELASYLAGERWSDHPSCTHPVLAALARDVNDQVGDSARARLLPLIPAVIGLRGEDPRVDAWIAREAALVALPVIAADRQNVAAAALLACERELARLEGRPSDEVSPRVGQALAEVPAARRWAQDLPSTVAGGVADFTRRSALVIVHLSVSALAAAVLPSRSPSDDAAPVDDLLVGLLAAAVELCRRPEGALMPPSPEAAEVTPERWQELAVLTARSRRGRPQLRVTSA